MENEKLEKKKLLLVAVSVGVFLVIVFSAAILFFFKPGAAPAATPPVSSVNPDHNRSATTNPSDLVRDEAFQGLLNPTAISPIQENYINIYGDAGMTVDSRSDTATTQTVINVPKPATAAVPDTKPAPEVQTRPAAQTRAVPTPVKPAAPAPAQVAPTRAAPAPVKPAAAPAPKKAYRDYWVQAGSFSTRERANGVKSTLDTKGISAIVTDQMINGNMYYRVRVGPYTSQNEADYWLVMIKSIDGFQDSQIWETQSYR